MVSHVDSLISGTGSPSALPNVPLLTSFPFGLLPNYPPCKQERYPACYVTTVNIPPSSRQGQNPGHTIATHQMNDFQSTIPKPNPLSMNNIGVSRAHNMSG